jgi:EmrB/QacA subfamily drug resistance transporter
MSESIVYSSKEQQIAAGPALVSRRWLTLAVVLVGTFMTILDSFIVNVALPSIERTINASPADLELVIASYLLIYAVFLITGGRLGDIFGRKKLFVLGMAIFTISSALCGLAPSPSILIVARAIQGFGAALMYPQVLSIIQVTFTGQDRNVALGLFAGVNGVAAVAGQLFGGLLIEINLSGLAWRPIFLVNVPIGIAGVIAGLIFLNESKASKMPRLDLQGVALITAALASFVLPLVEGQALGWPAWIIGLLALSLPLFVLFVVYERRKVSSGGFPLINTSLFLQRSFSVGIPLAVLFFSSLAGLFFVLSLFLQDGMGVTPLASGLIFTPLGIGFIVSSLSTPQMVRRFGRETLRMGFTLDLIGFLLLFVILRLYVSANDLAVLAVPLFIVGLGNGLGMSPLIGTVLAGTKTEDIGQASGMMSTALQIGNTVGVAIYGLLFFSSLGPLNVLSPRANFISAFEFTLIFFVAGATGCFVLVSGLSKPRGGEKDILLERLPRPLSGLAYSFFFITGGRIGKTLFNEMLEGAIKRRYDELKAEDDFPEHLARQFLEINREDPKWIRFLVREALNSEGEFEALGVEREKMLRSFVEDFRERQKKGSITKEVDPEYFALLMVAVSFYPRVFAHVTKAITGLAPSDPDFEKNWSEFLKVLAKKFEDSDETKGKTKAAIDS